MLAESQEVIRVFTYITDWDMIICKNEWMNEWKKKKKIIYIYEMVGWTSHYGDKFHPKGNMFVWADVIDQLTAKPNI